MSAFSSIHGFATGDVLVFRGGRSEWTVTSGASFSSGLTIRSTGGSIRTINAEDARVDLAFVAPPAEGYQERKRRVDEYVARAEALQEQYRAPEVGELSPRASANLDAELVAMHVGRPRNYDDALRALREARVDAMMRYVSEPTPANWATRAALNVAIVEAEKVKGLFA